MTRESWIEEFLINIEKLDDSEATKTLLDWADQISIETRAAALAEEDRRVWCERHAHYTANSGMGSSGAVEYANAELNRYREARAAWDARKEDQR